MVQERPVRVERRLSAILAADVAGYSRLMHNDEEATHSKVTALLTDAVAPAIAEHGGRIVKNTGDGFLAEFPSAVGAVRAAVQFQSRISELATGDMQDRRIAFRVGINIGDVIVEPHDIFGDGVNIAARLESIAEPGGICISSSAYDYVRGKVRVEFADLGEQNLKNIPGPVRAYAAVQANRNAILGPCSTPPLSIVLLPFKNISDDPAQEYFVDGVTESLTTDLSRIVGSFVIGRNTAFTYKGKPLDLKQLGRELNVRYVLQGSVQRGGDQLRINVQLVAAETGAQLWADRFDKPIANLFEVQDEIVSRLANQLEAQITEAEARRSERSPNPSSMELYFQGRSLFNRGWTPEYLTQARGSFERALALDRANIDALVGLALVDLVFGSSYMADDRAPFLARAELALIKVLSLAPNHAFAHGVFGALLITTKRAAQGLAECERALALDRNLAEAHAQMGIAKYTLGRGAETEAHVNEALRLSPRDVFAPRWFLYIGFAKLQLNEDTEALGWMLRSVEANRNYPIAHFFLAAALALLGSLDQARAAARAGLAINPGFTVSRFRNAAFSDDPGYLAFRERLYHGMRMAGVPEG
ncbi:adenylate/guanylate cyclase domain-containing protein [Bradyrhizobium sp.]|jgi:TolB-like protein|uniref:adenylate/guanylate cyclase domain-containing protein n=1 Tax=Bradyrhizobium sp. TaxID=376 RepID=UPI002CF1FA38|nr:adenylate/guanylate cyclase domain-containing protein [Bradyrhizobium sp.]HWX62334.1 adenylate/guanylate cyclase domain-containing protein [Bradyrhizobium sp.]